jgi:hypothetical protein
MTTQGVRFAVSLEQQLGRSLLVALPRAQLTIEGSIAPATHGFAAHFRVTDRDGVRSSRGAIESRRAGVAREAHSQEERPVPGRIHLGIGAA